MSTATKEDWAIAKSLVREWLMKKGVALTGVNGEASRSTINRFKLDLQRHIVAILTAERERAAGIAESLYADRIFDVDSILRAEIAAAIREGKPQE